ncbi:MAG: signal recognition particle-docking protein FtsY [Deltaproteobacteria bacterium]|nr:signal recognition particle-docking protein FtsY [Deltaproteobacteria bacterium]
MGGLGMWLSGGLFLLTFAIGIAVFFWFLKGQKLEKQQKQLEEFKESSADKATKLGVAKQDGATEKVATEKVATEKLKLAGMPEDADALVTRDEKKPSEKTSPEKTPAERTLPASLPTALGKTRASLFGRIQSLFGAKQTLSVSEREELEEILYTADLGPKTVQDLLDHVFEKVKASGETGFEAVRRELHTKIGEILTAKAVVQLADGDDGVERLNLFAAKPAVLMVVGVNGAGKTTTIGKLAAKLAGRGKRVLVAAGDTFRAAAGEQLKTWTDRAASQNGSGADSSGTLAMVEIFDPPGVSEPSAVAYQALERARASGFDIVIIDTAGRLHTQKNLMEELKKMKRVLTKLDPTAPHETLLVLDANSGQNALIQAKEFHGALVVDGVVLTKLDGSAKGGVAVGITNEVGLPIKLIGVGEKIGDLRPFEATRFVDSILT